MFMQIAIGAIGIGIVLMVGYLVIAQVAGSLAESLGDTEADNSTKDAVEATQGIVFAGFGLIAIGIIVLAAFGLINIFK
jgi:hypothetical protein